MKDNNVIDISAKIKVSPVVDSNLPVRSKYHTNPIYKKFLVINSKNDNKKFTVADLFE